MELTKEYFEEHLGKLLEHQTRELKAYTKSYTDEQTEKLAQITADTISGPYEERFSALETDMLRVKTVLKLS